MKPLIPGRANPLSHRFRWPLGLLVVPVFAACVAGQQPPAGAEPLLLALQFAQTGGHLEAALAHAREGRMDMAALHTAHPLAEDLPVIEPTLQARDAARAARLREALTGNLNPADATSLAVSVARTQAVLQEARQALVPPAVAGALAFRGSLLAALIDAAAEEYGEALAEGAVKRRDEYDDGYGFFQQALSLWGGLADEVRASAPLEHREIEAHLQNLRTAFPSIVPPARPLPAERVEEWAAALRHELAGATGFDEGAVLVSAGSAVEGVQALGKETDTIAQALAAGDLAGARRGYAEFAGGWGRIEDGVRSASRESYRRIEEAMAELKDALETEPVELARAGAALARLREATAAFVAAPTAGGSPPAGGEAVTLVSLVARLDRALDRLERGDAAGAAGEVGAFRRDWIEVEGLVKAKSGQAYADTENNMAKAYALLSRSQSDAAGAREVLLQMKADLAPFAEGEMRYGLFDAAIILLREGMEALLIVVALLAFLSKTGHSDKGRWIWGGAGAGVALSLVVALLVNVLFARAAAGANRELLEGLTGLAAAAMLIYVSYWLHSKSSLTAWQSYIRARSTAALARNSLLGLALISFLAVFREGAETVLFYLGIAPSIALADLLLGLGVGTAGLVVAGVAMLVFGLRVPVRPFFLGTSLLLYYLAFKFVGSGIHALQVAGILGATPGGLLPENGFLGIYPTLETTVVQGLLLVAAAALLLLQRLRPAPAVPSRL